MANTGTATSRLSLSTLFRSIRRSEFTRCRFDPHTVYERRGLYSPRAASNSSCPWKGKRCFSSLPSHYSSHLEDADSTSTEPLSTAPTTLNTSNQQSIPKDAATGNRSDVAPNSLYTEPDTSSSTSIDKSKRHAGSSDEKSTSSPKTDKRSTRDKQKKASKPTGHSTQKKKRKPEGWQIDKEALKTKFKEGWNPPKKLSPDALDAIRQLHGLAPDRFTTPVLAMEFKVSPEAIRRILKSKWRPSEEEMEDRRIRWQKRYDRIWSQMTELGLRSPTQRQTGYVSDVGVLYGNKGKKS